MARWLHSNVKLLYSVIQSIVLYRSRWRSRPSCLYKVPNDIKQAHPHSVPIISWKERELMKKFWNLQNKNQSDVTIVPSMAMGVTLDRINVTERHYNNQNLTFRIQNELESNDEHAEFNSILGIQKSSMLSYWTLFWLANWNNMFVLQLRLQLYYNNNNNIYHLLFTDWFANSPANWGSSVSIYLRKILTHTW